MREAVGTGVGVGVELDGESGAAVKQTIVLVEDETIVRTLMAEVLRSEGYEVVSCADPYAAIEACKGREGKIDLLLTDVVMPGMNGLEMANRILETLPELRVLVMSGYTQNVLVNEGLIDPQFEYLQKPFALRALMKKLGSVLPVRERKQ